MYIDACARNVRVSKIFFAILILQVYVGIYVCMYACMYICIYMQARHESVTKNFFQHYFSISMYMDVFARNARVSKNFFAILIL